MTGSCLLWPQKVLLRFPASTTLGRSKNVFLRRKRCFFHILCGNRKNEPARSLIQNTSFEAVYLLWGRHILKSLFFVKWRALKSLPPSTEQENSCLLASASCEQLHRQTPSLQLSSSVLIFTLANPYTKRNSFNCRWWASEREWTPAFLAAKNLFGICHTDEQFEFSSSICLTTIMACWAFLKYSCLPLTRNFVMALRRYPMQSVFSSCFVPGLLLWVSAVSTSGLGSGEHSIPAVFVRTTKLEW